MLEVAEFQPPPLAATETGGVFAQPSTWVALAAIGLIVGLAVGLLIATMGGRRGRSRRVGLLWKRSRRAWRPRDPTAARRRRLRGPRVMETWKRQSTLEETNEAELSAGGEDGGQNGPPVRAEGRSVLAVLVVLLMLGNMVPAGQGLSLAHTPLGGATTPFQRVSSSPAPSAHLATAGGSAPPSGPMPPLSKAPTPSGNCGPKTWCPAVSVTGQFYTSTGVALPATANEPCALPLVAGVCTESAGFGALSRRPSRRGSARRMTRR